MPPDTLTALVAEADQLDTNSRLLRMFELEPIITAAPDSPQKHRALARVYAALGRYQTAFTHFQAASDRKDPQDRADFAYLKNLAEHYGDDKQPAERPLPITPELKAALPQFKYCPDPLASGIFRTQEKAVSCDCCRRDTHVFYTHPFYSCDDINALCPECIASGRAAEELEGEFVIRDDVSQEIGKAQQDELCLRTPSYSSWQEAQWADHCGDYCAFVGYAGWEDLQRQGIAEGIEWLGSPPEPEERQYISTNGSMVGCLFRCLHCHQHILHVDLD